MARNCGGMNVTQATLTKIALEAFVGALPVGIRERNGPERKALIKDKALLETANPFLYIAQNPAARNSITNPFRTNNPASWIKN